jgi:transposase
METEARKQRGLQIAALARIDKQDGLYLVPSQYNPRPTKYKVNMGLMFPTCTCPDYETRGCKCKHIYAVEYVIQREQNADGSTTVRETLTVTKERKTYKQDWPAYNKAQTNEKREFQTLLHDLCQTVPANAIQRQRRGRPSLPLSDAIFSVVFKVYCTLSARRFASDLCDAQAKGYIDKVPHFNSVLNYLETPELFPILTDMIERTSLPLRSVETNFAVDSTGFTACRFVRWFDVKYNRFTAEQQWVKAHIMCGVKTNIVTAIEIHGRDSGDSLHFPALVANTAQRFTVKEVCADKGYSGRPAYEALNKIGATGYIAFKANSTGGVGGMFERMWHYYNCNRETFLEHYHQRSNIESTVMMIKTKFGDSVRSKTDVAARNEVLCKVLAHNICCNISANHELGIQPNFPRTINPMPAHLSGPNQG